MTRQNVESTESKTDRQTKAKTESHKKREASEQIGCSWQLQLKEFTDNDLRIKTMLAGMLLYEMDVYMCYYELHK